MTWTLALNEGIITMQLLLSSNISTEFSTRSLVFVFVVFGAIEFFFKTFQNCVCKPAVHVEHQNRSTGSVDGSLGPEKRKKKPTCHRSPWASPELRWMGEYSVIVSLHLIKKMGYFLIKKPANVCSVFCKYIRREHFLVPSKLDYSWSISIQHFIKLNIFFISVRFIELQNKSSEWIQYSLVLVLVQVVRTK